MGSSAVCSCSCQNKEKNEEVSLVVSLIYLTNQNQPVTQDFTAKPRTSNPIYQSKLIKLSYSEYIKFTNLQRFLKRYLKSKMIGASIQHARASFIDRELIDESKGNASFISNQAKFRNNNNQHASSEFSKAPLVEEHHKHSLRVVRSSFRENSVSRNISVKYAGTGGRFKADSADLANKRLAESGVEFKTWEDGSYFIGYIKKEKANGCGIFVHSSGDMYKGEFYDDKSSGYGSYINNIKYSECYGEWYDDNQNGYGVEIWKDNSYYIGQFKEGRKHGIGTYKWANGSMYEGEWSSGCFNGYGIYTFNESKKYMGQFKNNMIHGYGEFYWETHLYIGNYIEEKKDGFGIYYWFNPLKVYVGMWENGKQQGLGKVMTEKYSKFAMWSGGKKTEFIQNPEKRLGELKNKKIASLMVMSLLELKDHLFNTY